MKQTVLANYILLNFSVKKKKSSQENDLKNHQKAKGQDVQDFRQYLRKSTIREQLYQGGQSAEQQNSFPVVMNTLKLTVQLVTISGSWSKTEGKSLAQEAEWPTET